MVPLISDNLDAITDLCRKHKVRRLFLIGSALGDEFDSEQSDVDFVVDFLPDEPDEDPYFGLLAELSTLLHRPVDLIEAKALRNPYFIASINKTKKMLYAA